MKLLVSLLCLFSLGVAQASAASLLLAAAEVPLSMTFNSGSNGQLKSDGMPQGLILTAEVPLLMALGVESYEIKLKDTNGSSLQTQMYDALWILPLPLVSLGIGAGFGFQNPTGPLASAYDSANISQVMLRLGLPVFGPLQARMSYQRIYSSLSSKTGGSDLQTGGSLIAAGVGFDF
ncbi:MAG: hypothetical protein RRB13_01995 [bacterium]|nr:hypothetical protein [bacterium]